MARPAANLHLQAKNGGWRAGLSTGRATFIDREKLFFTPVWRVPIDEAAALAYPEVRKFETLIERARSGMPYAEAVEMEA